MYFGIELGFYEALAEQGSATPDQLAGSCETSERYTREWCEQQPAFGLIRFESGAFSLDPGHAEVLTDVHSEFFLAPLARMIGSSAARPDELKAAYRSVGGVSWEAFGPSMRESQSDMNRPFFEHGLAAGLAEVDSLHEILSRPNARIADVGCGGGWSAIALAKAYPAATVVGYDIDCPSIEMAKVHAASEGLSDRIAFDCVGVRLLDVGNSFDAVFAFECIHDMPAPVGVLTAVRTLVRETALLL